MAIVVTGYVLRGSAEVVVDRGKVETETWFTIDETEEHWVEGARL